MLYYRPIRGARGCVLPGAFGSDDICDMEKTIEGARRPMDVYAAIKEMRKISEQGGTFSLKHRKWDRQRGKGGDLVHVSEARLRPAAKDEQVENSDFKLFYTDTQTGMGKVCWQMLLVEFNGHKLSLN